VYQAARAISWALKQVQCDEDGTYDFHRGEHVLRVAFGEAGAGYTGIPDEITTGQEDDSAKKPKRPPTLGLSGIKLSELLHRIYSPEGFRGKEKVTLTRAELHKEKERQFYVQRFKSDVQDKIKRDSSIGLMVMFTGIRLKIDRKNV